ncbi:MAG: hypothetical protein HN929_03180 [Chloroflexi bacterium]|jgi:Tol biopolymer transport system component|nr:hypothetical protein [Chloroflexota bacterium]MBT7080463.1 hypothetical protein [Chloroflexota bacterium]
MKSFRIVPAIFSVLALSGGLLACGGPIAHTISGVSATSYSDSEATIIWSTTVASSSQVEYGLTTDYGSRSTLDSTMKLDHTVDLVDLDANTTYHYCVISKEEEDKQTISDDYTFTTPTTTEVIETLTISNCAATDIDTTTAVIEWDTNLASTSLVEYGTTDSYDTTTTFDTTLETAHSVSLTGLEIETTYHYRVKSKLDADTEVVSDDYTFSTNATVITEFIPGKIAFVAHKDLGNDPGDPYPDIFIMNDDGTNIVQLTDNNANNTSPCLSPDGSKIAFSSDRDGDMNIYSMDVNGSNVVRLTNSASQDFSPSWSPDGAKIVFSSFGNSETTLHVMNADGTSQTLLTSSSGDKPTWSSDGNRIAFVSNANIRIINADGTGETGLISVGAKHINHISWSPNGNQIVYDVINSDWDSEGLFTVNLTGSIIKALPVTEALQYASWPCWSPEGARIAFSTTRTPPQGICTVNADGSNLVWLTPDDVEVYGPSWGPGSIELPAPIEDLNIHLVTVTANSDTSVVITWATNRDATSQVAYDITDDYGETTMVTTSLVTSHSVELTGLMPETEYHYQVISTTDTDDDASTDATFTTLAAADIADNTTMTFYVNHRHEPWNLPEFRNAVSIGIDRLNMVNAVDTLAQIPVMLERDKDIDDVISGIEWPNQDKTHAQRIALANTALDTIPNMTTIADGGGTYRKYDGVTLAFDMMAVSIYPDDMAAAELIKTDLAELGIDMTIVPAPSPTVIVSDIFRQRNESTLDDWETCIWGRPLLPEYDDFAGEWGYYSTNEYGKRSFIMGWDSAQAQLIGEKLNALQALPEGDSTRNALIAETQQLWADDLPAIPLYHVISIELPDE